MDVDGPHAFVLSHQPTSPADVLPRLPAEPLPAARLDAASSSHGAHDASRSSGHRFHDNNLSVL